MVYKSHVRIPDLGFRRFLAGASAQMSKAKGSKLQGPLVSGQILASLNEVTLDSGYRWQYTKTGPNSEFGISITSPDGLF